MVTRHFDNPNLYSQLQLENYKHFMNKLLFSLSLLFIIKSTSANPSISLSEVFALEEIVISASKQAEPIQEAPVPVTLITSKMIEQSGARNLRDILSWYVPGMSVVTDHNEYNISMRGVYASSQQKILILLNGHRLNSRVYSEAGVGYGIGLDKIQQIEVLRGPASSLYGNVALAAVINILTKQPEDLFNNTVTVSYGSNSTKKLSILAPIQNQRFESLVWGELYKSSGEKLFVSKSNDYSLTPIDAEVYIDRVKDQPAYDFGFTSKFKKFDLLFNVRNEISGATFASSGSSPNYNLGSVGSFSGLHEGIASKSLHSRLKYSHQYSKTHRITSEIYHNRNRLQGNLVLNTSPLLGGGIQWKDRNFGLNSHFELDYNKTNNSQGNFSYGFQVDRMENYSSTLAIGADPSQATNGHLLDTGTETIYSSYMQVKHHIGSQYIYNIGLRYDSKKRLEGPKVSNASPRIAVIYKQNEQQSLKLSYSESFVDAPFWYRYNVLASYKGSRNLKPEYLKSWQLTPSFVSKNKDVKYQFNVFYNQLSDFVFRDKTATGNQARYRNAGSLDSVGYELEASFQIQRNQNLLFNYTHQRALQSQDYGTSNSDIHNIPRDIANIQWNKQTETKSGNDVNFNIGLNWYSSQVSPINSPLNGTVYSNPLHKEPSRLIAQAGVRISTDESTSISHFVDFRIYNLFDKNYQQGGSTAHPYQQQGRSFIISLGYKF